MRNKTYYFLVFLFLILLIFLLPNKIYGVDTIAPIIDTTSLKISNNSATIGDKIKISVKATDNSEELKYVRVWYIKPITKDFKIIDLQYNNTTKLCEGTITIDNMWENGEYLIFSIYASDETENTTEIYNNKNEKAEYGNPKADLSAGDFTVYGTSGADTISPVIDATSVKISNNSATIGDEIKISLRVTDNSEEIEFVYLWYTKPITKDSKSIDLEYNSITQLYEGTITIDNTCENGDYLIKYISASDETGNTTGIYNSKNEEAEFGNPKADLSAGDFTVYGTSGADTISPVIDATSIKISNNSATIGDKINISVKATDNSEELKYVRMWYTEPITKEFKIIDLQYNSTTKLCEGTITIDNMWENGEYLIFSIYASDETGNTTEIYNNKNEKAEYGNPKADLSAGNFTIYELKQEKQENKINIISPSQYLDFTTSYNLQAIIFPKKEIATNITWASSDISIATINPDTGIISTKNKEGEVTIYARVNDGSGEYGTIKLYVTAAKVKVNNTISIGNSSYVTYSDVIWEIEDATILQKTGQSGLVQINNYYKHSIGVRGIKTGKTKVYMKTPSGDLLAKSTVYVYDLITSIASDKQELNLKKGQTEKINVSILPNTLNKDNELFYTTDNNKVATVDEKGNVTAIGNGTTNINVYAKYNKNIKLTIPVTVIVNSSDILIESTTINLNNENKTYKIKYTVLPEDATNKDVNFTSANENIATVDANGVITAIRNGKTKITIATEDGMQKKDIELNIEGIVIDINSLAYEEIVDLIYNNLEQRPDVVIKDLAYTLKNGVDYNLSYKNNKNVGEATVIITGINKYKGTKNVYFNIKNATIEYTSKDYSGIYDGKEHSIDLSTTTDNATIKYADTNGEYNLTKKPKYRDVGTYIVNYIINAKNYNTIKGTNRINIYGIKNIDSTLSLRDTKLTIKDATNSVRKLFNKFNIFALNSVYNHLDKNKNIDNTDNLNTGDYFQIKINDEKMFEYEVIILGDINKDRKVNARDARLALQYFAGKINFTDEEKMISDVNNDGKINARDARLILQLFAGKIKSF